MNFNASISSLSIIAMLSVSAATYNSKDGAIERLKTSSPTANRVVEHYNSCLGNRDYHNAITANDCKEKTVEKIIVECGPAKTREAYTVIDSYEKIMYGEK